MLSRHVAYYGLLICLVALLALGLQPFRAGKLTLEQRGTSEKAPSGEPTEEEEEAEEESESITPIRRKVLVWLHASGECRFVAAAVFNSSPHISRSFAPHLSCEQSARNGIGGPLRL
ncbi:MAG: hypothetical protein K8R36_25560 [Planctomycetales bacterium]|nr:hypothetical protein [Planctomycetales bacterium]